MYISKTKMLQHMAFYLRIRKEVKGIHSLLASAFHDLGLLDGLLWYRASVCEVYLKISFSWLVPENLEWD
jgi:hypothetical protein